MCVCVCVCANRGAWTSSPTTSTKVTVPKGYHNGSGYVDTSGVYNAGVSAGTSSAAASSEIIVHTYIPDGGASSDMATFSTRRFCMNVSSFKTISGSFYIGIYGGAAIFLGSGKSTKTTKIAAQSARSAQTVTIPSTSISSSTPYLLIYVSKDSTIGEATFTINLS